MFEVSSYLVRRRSGLTGTRRDAGRRGAPDLHGSACAALSLCFPGAAPALSWHWDAATLAQQGQPPAAPSPPPPGGRPGAGREAARALAPGRRRHNRCQRAAGRGRAPLTEARRAGPSGCSCTHSLGVMSCRLDHQVLPGGEKGGGRVRPRAAPEVRGLRVPNTGGLGPALRPPAEAKPMSARLLGHLAVLATQFRGMRARQGKAA